MSGRADVETRRRGVSAAGAPFSGFPNSAEATVIPRVFFAQILPEITDPAELIVTMWVFFAQALNKRRPHFITRSELRADPTLARSLANLAPEADAALDRGLNLAVRRGTLARATIRRGEWHSPPTPRTAVSSVPPWSGREQVYVVNTPANRTALEPLLDHGAEMERPVARPATAPDIFTLYEQQVGPLTPLIADGLTDAEKQYPPEWIAAAFREAADLNKRNWRYIQRILERWEAEGPNYEKPQRDPEAEWLARRYTEGKQRPA
jgi:DNA replication protein